MVDFGGAQKWARAIILQAIVPGSRVIDATMGNGHDTQWLAESVGEEGKVYAFDVQEAALNRTKERLCARGLFGRAELILDGHEHMADHIEGTVDAVVFNLGWLPGSPHDCTTRTETTLQAVNSALSLIGRGGVVTICVYPGHEEGARERDELVKWAQALDDKVYDAMICAYANICKKPPLMIAVTKRG